MNPRCSLPRVSAAAVERLNRLAKRREPLAVDVLMPGLSLSLSPRNPARAPGEGLFGLAGQWGVAGVQVRADRHWLGDVVQAALGAELPDEAPALVRRAMVEASIGPAITQFEQSSGRHLHLRDDAAPPAVHGMLHGIQWQAQAGGRIGEGELWLDDSGLDQLVALVEPAAPGRLEAPPPAGDRRFDALPLPLRLGVGWVDLAFGQLKTLREHDVLLLDESWVGPDGAITLRVGRDSALLGRIDGTRIAITHAWTDIMSDRLDDDEFDDDFDEFDDDDDEEDEEGDDDEFDDDDEDGLDEPDGEPDDDGDTREAPPRHPPALRDAPGDDAAPALKPAPERAPPQRPHVDAVAANPPPPPPAEPRRSAAARLETVPVRVTFDLGQRSLTLAELREIGPGHVFELGRELRRCVQVRANGRLIGEGELVDVDGRLGVSILSLRGVS
jgi:type III secretion system YscQ/HrcQ family protein